MSRTNETRHGANVAGSETVISLAADASDNAPKSHVSQAKIDLLVDDIGCNIGALVDALAVADAMIRAGDSVGLVYSLRRARCYWRAISGSAGELVTSDAERLSAIRQECGQ